MNNLPGPSDFSDPPNTVSPSRTLPPQTILGSDKEDWVPYDGQNRLDETKGLFCVKWSPPIDRFYDFVKYFRKITGINLGGTRQSKYIYQDPTIAKVMSVGPEDHPSSLPQRVTLSNFKLGTPITSYGCICRYYHEGLDEPEYLLIRRNSSTSYIDLVRGTYQNSQLFFMIQDLSNVERRRLIEYSFDELWYDLHLKPPEGEAYQMGREKFDLIKDVLEDLFKEFPSRDPEGLYLWLFPKGKPDYRPISSYAQSQTIIPLSKLPSSLPSSTTTTSSSTTSSTSTSDISGLRFADSTGLITPVYEHERYVPESPFESALREFTEETNGIMLDESNLRMDNPVLEKYLGSNSKNYQTTYFVFQVDTKLEITPFPRAETPLRQLSVGEADLIEWVKYSEIDKYLCPARLQLLEYIEKHLPDRSPGVLSEFWKRPAELLEFQIE